MAATPEAEAYIDRKGADIEATMTELLHELIRTEAPDPRSLLLAFEQQQRVQRPDAIEAAVQQARNAPVSEGDAEWSVSSWLGESTAGPVAAALTRPLDDNAPAHIQLGFLRALNGDRGLVRALLDDRVLDGIADAVCSAATQLAGGVTAEALSEKFAETTFTLSYGGLDSFFHGLEGL